MSRKLTLRSARVRPLLVPLSRPIVARIMRFDTFPLIAIDLQTEQGIVGRSYLEPYLAGSMRAIVPLIEAWCEARVGKPLVPLDDYQAFRKSLNFVGLEGISLIAVSGIDMAIWDALAQAAGLPLAVLLGGSVAPVPAYSSGGMWLTDVTTLGREAQELVAEGGFRGLKVRLGRQRAADDIEAIRVIREAVGEDVKLMIDFNQALPLGDALDRCHALDDLGLCWFEEPIAYDNLAGHAQLARELDTPVQLGENFYGPRALYEALRAGAGDYYMPDLMRIGGVSGWLRAAPVAAAAGIQVSTHLYPEFSAHVMRVTETAHWLEWQDYANPILERPFEVRDGFIHIPDVPGSGVAWNEDAVGRFRYDG
ncbi:MAG TPA: enolase C-terminal domain-like protein [Burkholderiales bacterium]|nr:enolase C-terminal domain-like protein [Burkholderiales bacterium]